jgi:hypothetical protein
MKKFISRFESFTLINIQVNEWNGLVFEILSFEYLGFTYSLLNVGYGPGSYFSLEVLGMMHIWPSKLNNNDL